MVLQALFQAALLSVMHIFGKCNSGITLKGLTLVQV